jgi:hypothetical protein
LLRLWTPTILKCCCFAIFRKDVVAKILNMVAAQIENHQLAELMD